MTKQRGELAQLRFLLRALERGFVISLPYGDSSKYDCIVDWMGKLSRIQVKSTAHKDISNRQNRYKILAASGADNKTPYTKTDVDILAAYVVPEDAWYIIPVERLERKLTINLAPHRKDNNGKYEEFREAWGLLC